MHNAVNVWAFCKNFVSGDYSDPGIPAQLGAGWVEWHCADTELVHRTQKLGLLICQIVDSHKFDKKKDRVALKNMVTPSGKTLDYFCIVDSETGRLLYCVIPLDEDDYARVMKVENGYAGPVLRGDWPDIVRYFCP